jgi:hypothetical protein
MRTLSLTVLLLLAALSPAAPALAEKPVRYEYAELRYSRYSQAQPGMPGAPPQVVTKIDIRWATGDEEIQAESWDDLARKLKAAEPKREATATVHKMRVLNRLSADGWEIVERPVLEAGGTGTWQYRRKLP